jgi:hypothetical protein
MIDFQLKITDHVSLSLPPNKDDAPPGGGVRSVQRIEKIENIVNNRYRIIEGLLLLKYLSKSCINKSILKTNNIVKNIKKIENIDKVIIRFQPGVCRFLI